MTTTAKHRERASWITAYYVKHFRISVDGECDLNEEIAEAIAAAHAEGREEMREEAAKVAENWLTEFSAREIIYISSRQYATNAVEDIRDVIRALPKDTGNG